MRTDKQTNRQTDKQTLLKNRWCSKNKPLGTPPGGLAAKINMVEIDNNTSFSLHEVEGKPDITPKDRNFQKTMVKKKTLYKKTGRYIDIKHEYINWQILIQRY